MDCDRDSLIYLSEPIGPACHTNAPTCYFQQARGWGGGWMDGGEGEPADELASARVCCVAAAELCRLPIGHGLTLPFASPPPACVQLDASSGEMRTAGDHQSMEHAPLATLFALERTIAQRRAEAEAGTAPGACCVRRAAR